VSDKDEVGEAAHEKVSSVSGNGGRLHCYDLKGRCMTVNMQHVSGYVCFRVTINTKPQSHVTRQLHVIGNAGRLICCGS